MKKPLLFPMLNNAMNSLSKFAFTLLISIFMVFQAAATDYFVDASKATTNDVASGGLTWETAFKTVPFALSVADNAGDNRIFIKQGTYVMTNVAYTFVNKSLTIQGGFPTAAAGIDISGYNLSLVPLTVLDYNKVIIGVSTVILQNTGAGPYEVNFKGFTTRGMGISGTTSGSLFTANIANTANTAFTFTDMRHMDTNATSTGTGAAPQCGTKGIYILGNLLATNSISFTNCLFGDIRGLGSSLGTGVTINGSAVAPTFTTCVIDGPSNVSDGGIIWLENITASPIANFATDNVFKNINVGSAITLYGNSGDFIIDGIIAPIENNVGTAFLGSFLLAYGNITPSVAASTPVLNAGKITVKNCKFTNNTQDAMRIDASGGKGDIEISNNIFTNNITGSGTGGGAVHISGVNPGNATAMLNIPNVKIFGNTFTGNGATNGTTAMGGAVIFYGSSAFISQFKTIDIYDNTFTSNYAIAAGGTGGALDLFGINPDVVNITNNTFTNNKANDKGGAIFVRAVASPVNITNDNFCGNATTGGDGGAVLVESSPTATTTLNINSCVFNANVASNAGSALFVNNINDMHVNTTTFSQNSASAATIYITAVAATSEIDSCVFVYNNASGVAGINFVNMIAPFSLTKCNFTKNAASNNVVGAISFTSAATPIPSFLVQDCLFDQNSSEVSIGAITFSGSGTNFSNLVSIDRCVFNGNYYGYNPLVTNRVGSDINLITAPSILQPNITNSYLQSPLTTTNYKAANILPAANNVVIASTNTFDATLPNGCNPVPLVYQLDAPGATPAGTIDCAKTQISPAPVAGTASQVDLIVTINVTTAGEFTPITLGGSGMTLANGVTSITATTTGIQQFHIPIKYDGTALGTLNFQIGTLTACTANLTLAPKSVISPIWTLDNCSPVQVGPALK